MFGSMLSAMSPSFQDVQANSEQNAALQRRQELPRDTALAVSHGYSLIHLWLAPMHTHSVDRQFVTLCCVVFVSGGKRGRCLKASPSCAPWDVSMFKHPYACFNVGWGLPKGCRL